MQHLNFEQNLENEKLEESFFEVVAKVSKSTAVSACRELDEVLDLLERAKVLLRAASSTEKAVGWLSLHCAEEAVSRTFEQVNELLCDCEKQA